MKKVKPDNLLAQMNAYQYSEFIARLKQDTDENVLPVLEENAVYEFEHFMTIPGKDGNRDLHLSVEANYRNRQTLIRRLRKAKVYESEVEMEFYMTISEYEGELSESNPLFFIFN